MFVLMTVGEAIKQISTQLLAIYSAGESNSIARWVIEHFTESSNQNFTVNQFELSAEQKENLPLIVSRLLEHEPIQYVLNESWFCGLNFYVDKNVLIPRPETEELVEWIVTDCGIPFDKLKILDIGSGSGCIAISIKRKIQKTEVWGCDISSDALKVAKKNSANLEVDVNFIQLDFLDNTQWQKLPSFDIIVSNPPYIPKKGAEDMQPNVLQYEPATALFVPDNDPLVFYKAIAEFGKQHLNKAGAIYTEIHEDLGEATMNIFKAAGYRSELKKDMQQKDRMIKSSLLL